MSVFDFDPESELAEILRRNDKKLETEDRILGPILIGTFFLFIALLLTKSLFSPSLSSVEDSSSSLDSKHSESTQQLSPAHDQERLPVSLTPTRRPS